jgi:tetratricopeptide (TPR) repeat protein
MLNKYAKKLCFILMLSVVSGCASFGQKEDTETVDPRSAPVPSDIEKKYGAALELLKSQEFDEAEAEFKAITQSHNYYSGPWKNLGIIYSHKKKYDEAIEVFEKAQAIDSNSDTLKQLALMHRKKGGFQKARELYEEGLTSFTEDAQIHLNLGILLDMYIGDIRAALPHYKQYQELTGNDNKMVNGWVVDLSRRIEKLAPIEVATSQVDANPIDAEQEGSVDDVKDIENATEDSSSDEDAKDIVIATEDSDLDNDAQDTAVPAEHSDIVETDTNSEEDL